MKCRCKNLRNERLSSVISLIMVAMAVSLIVNFSHLLLLAVDEFGSWRSENQEDAAKMIEVRGRLAMNPDGYAYLVCEPAEAIDSVYMSYWNLRNIDVESGDTLRVKAKPATREGGHYRMAEILEINGEEFDYTTEFTRPNKILDSAVQIVYYFIMSLMILLLLTYKADRRNVTFTNILHRSLWCVLLLIGFYFLAPVSNRYTGEIIPVFAMNDAWRIDYMVVLKCSFTFAVSVLYAYIYTLIYQRQSILLENEQLKSENLTTRYDMLVSQINPHFFFNSLNSLSTLVRENDTKKALTYIDQLSYTFRYVLQNSQNMEVPLKEELAFVEAYSYQFKIRYADKIFFDINISDDYLDYMLPSLSLQPLIDNAVKHNAITSRHPMHISIYVEDGMLIVSNPKSPLVEPAQGTGIGLSNLNSRWELIAGKSIEIVDTKDSFMVKLPLLKPHN
ncbi:MAG: histidine kinase [Alistipes sp.]|nr:histidine kinase [Alistipes sp.]